ncbi:peptidylprolyl isomerase [Algivirga pacifica]
MKEPLFHFLLIGAVLFFVYDRTQETHTEEKQIVIDDNHLNHLISLWQLKWQRPPTQEELNGIVQKYIRQEILYREALRMNLDHNDEMIKSRLAQKMEFLSDDLTTLSDPVTDETLKGYYTSNQSSYQSPETYSFYQVVFSEDRYKEPMREAKRLLRNMPDASPEVLHAYGSLRALPFFIQEQNKQQVENTFGGSLHQALSKLPTEQWYGPVQSAYGTHILYLTQKTPPKDLPFEQVKKVLQRDYEYNRAQQNREAMYEQMKNNYKIKIETELYSAVSSEQ